MGKSREVENYKFQFKRSFFIRNQKTTKNINLSTNNKLSNNSKILQALTLQVADSSQEAS